MEEFIVSARKYRPTSFSTLVGQDNIAATLKNSIVRGQLAHAYLFCGPRGVGKTSSARIFAKTINCLNPDENMEPCGKCESCRAFQEGRSFTIHELDAASNNSVEDIRQLIEQVRIQPQIGKYSVFIIDEVHMLSSAAFNAFLKTLEEPPAHAIFILATTEKHKILPTILSRCQVYDFNRISVEGIISNLQEIAEKENIHIEEGALHVIAVKADGAMRDALTLFDQMTAFCGKDITYQDVIRNLNVLDYEYYFRMTDLILEGRHIDAMLLLSDIIGRGFSPLIFISGLASHFRDLTVSKDERSAGLLEVPGPVRERYRAQAAGCSVRFLFEALSITSAAESGYRQSANKRLHIEYALFRLCRITGGNADDETAAPPVHRTAAVPAAATAVTANEKEDKPEKASVPASGLRNDGPEKTSDSSRTADQVSGIQSGTMSGPASQDSGKAEADRTEIQEKTKDKAYTEKSPAETAAAGKVRKSRFSIKALSEMAEKNRLSSTKETEVQQHCKVTEEDLSAAWLEMAKAEKAPRLSSTLASSLPVLSEDGFTVTFMVSNSVQKTWMEDNCVARLQKFLQVRLKNSDILLKIDILPHEDTGKPRLYMPDEKAKFMLEKNPQLDRLRKDLDLEIK